MPELMRASVWRIDLGSPERAVHDRANGVRPFHQPADRRHGPKEEMTVLAGGPPVLKIAGDRLTHVVDQGQESLLPALAVYPQLGVIPVHVTQRQPHDLDGAKSQSREE
jgi:hypothetical protein